MAALASPDGEDALYLYRGDDVIEARPLMQGDVFVEVADASVPLIVVTHPCSMRAGTQFRKALAVVEVVDYQSIPLRKWAGDFFDWMPLPGLPDAGENPAADFRRIATVPTEDLLSGRRIACLSEDGIQLLQQRFVHHLTRVVVDLHTLYEHSSPVFTETELQEEWVERALESGADAEEEIAAFQGYLGAGPGSLREALQKPRRRGDVRRQVRSAIDERFQ